jgi:Ring finger domain
MTGIVDPVRSRSRRERTFVGSECAACEEPLEHTLRGERILQFSCGHVSHEACFYEYIRESDSQYCPTCEAPLGLDTTRGGTILDIGTLRKLAAF